MSHNSSVNQPVFKSHNATTSSEIAAHDAGIVSGNHLGAAVNSSTEEDEEVMGLSRLFISEDYVVKQFTFGHLTQDLLCSNMSCTSHDLTGQIIWPAAILLSHFVHHIRDKLTGCTVIELGAGCGLAGFVAANYCSKSIITDGNEVVTRLLSRNNTMLNTSNTIISSLVWGCIPQLKSLLADHGPIDCIIGADVILWPQHVRELLLTIRLLLASKPKTSSCYISYVVRATSTTTLLFKHAKALHLSIEDVPVSSFFNSALQQDVALLSLEKHLFKICLLDRQVIHYDDEIILAEEENGLYVKEAQIGYVGSAF